MKDFLIDRYKIINLIGEGGMAKVYKAQHVRLGNVVAIKILHEELVRKSNIKQRFENEARIMAELTHPNIVKIIDYIEQDQILAIVMEYLEGLSLSSYIRQRKKLSNQEIKHFFTQVLDAFNLAHQKGIVHRDIKPSNIFVEKTNTIKILDFGIAKLVSSDLSITNAGQQMGSPLYMSPEQVRDSRNIDNLSDIYSLGVVLYHMVNGNPLYNDTSLSKFDIFNKIVYEPIPPLTDRPEFNHVIQKATQKNPSDRYLTCSEFLRDFNRIFEVGQTGHDDPRITENLKKEDKKDTKPSEKSLKSNIKDKTNETKTKNTVKKKKVVRKTDGKKKNDRQKNQRVRRTGKQKKVKKSGAGKAVWFILILLLLAGGGYFVYDNMQRTDEDSGINPPTGTTPDDGGKPETPKQERTHFTEKFRNNLANSITETSQQNYLMAVKADPAIIIKISNKGEKSGIYNISGIENPFVAADGKGEFFVVGNSKYYTKGIVISKFKENDSVWEKYYKEDILINNVYVDSKNNLLILVNMLSNGIRKNAVVLKYNNKGEQVAKILLDKRDVLYDVRENNNGYMFVGESKGKALILLTDMGLNKKSSKTFSFGKKVTGITKLDNAFYIVGEQKSEGDTNVFLMKLNSTGSSQWNDAKIFGEKNTFEVKPAIAVNGDKLIVATTQKSLSGRNTSIFVINKSGLTVGKDSEPNLELLSLKECRDGSIIMTTFNKNKKLTKVKKFFLNL